MIAICNLEWNESMNESNLVIVSSDTVLAQLCAILIVLYLVQ